MTRQLTGRGSVGALTIRRGADWQHDTAPPLVRGRDLSLRATADDVSSTPGGFEGWAVIFGVQDTYGTTFQPGSFVAGGLDDNARYPLLWMHSGMVPLGTFTAEERDKGLWLAGDYDPTPDGQTARARALSGSAPELSVGFVWLDDGGEDEPDLITKARLVETSQITLRMAAVPGAGMQAVRDMDETALEVAVAVRARAAALLDLRLVEAEVW